jgi:hypothetical protein
METSAARGGQKLEDLTPEHLEELWAAAKSAL